MGTNYYFKVKPNQFIEDTLDRLELFYFIDESIISSIRDGFRIHIGKRSGGWLPLFQKNKYYDSMDKLEKFYEIHKNDLDIQDEYGEKLTWDELKEALFNWDGGIRCNNPKTHLSILYNDCDKDKRGYEWCEGEFS